MPLVLPKLDDVTWEQFNEEARALIPGLAPDWTNFNASDPGITILELLAHFSEILLFRTDQITQAQIVLFLRMLNGPSWQPRTSLVEERQATLQAMARPHRAVTASDFEALAIEATDASAERFAPTAQRVARAKCIVNINLAAGNEEAQNAHAPGHMSVVVVTHENPVPPPNTLRRVKKVLEAARLITTRVHVVGPTFVTFRVRLTLRIANEASVEWVTNAAINRLEDFFDPLRGGADEKGWPFGRSIYVSELYLLLSKIPGVDYVVPTGSSSEGEEQAEIQVEAPEQWRKHYNALQELELIELRQHELPHLEIEAADIRIRRKRAVR